MLRTLKINENVYATLQIASEKTKLSIKTLAEICVTYSIEMLKNPGKLEEMIGMFTVYEKENK